MPEPSHRGAQAADARSRLANALPWAASALLHGVLAGLMILLPAEATPPPRQPPIEVIDRPQPPPRDQPEPESKAEPPAAPAETPRLAMTTKLPPRVRPRTPPPSKTEPPPEQPPEDTGPKTFGLRLEGGTTAPSGQGVPVPQGDSLRVSPKVTKKGKAPDRPAAPTGFKKEYGAGEEAPLAVITAYPKVLKQVTADYPERMKELGIEGKVILEVTVGASGKVAGARLVKSLHPELDRIALLAAQQLLFSPALVGKTPVKLKIPYTFVFVLD